MTGLRHILLASSYKNIEVAGCTRNPVDRESVSSDDKILNSSLIETLDEVAHVLE